MKISLIGCGWFGMELAKNLSGHELFGSTTTPEKMPLIKSLGATPVLFKEGPAPMELMNSDIIILNIPPTKKKLQEIKNWPWDKKAWVIFISSTSVYGQEGLVDESTIPLPDTENGIELLSQEVWLKSFFPSWTILRFAGLIGKDRHPGKILAGKTNLSGGKQPVNLLHLQDAVGFTKKIIETGMKNKIFNVVSDEHSTREKFYTEFALRNGLNPPQFDQGDNSTGKVVQNLELKKIYKLECPKMIGTAL